MDGFCECNGPHNLKTQLITEWPEIMSGTGP